MNKQALVDELLGSLNSPSGRVRLLQAESPLGVEGQCPAVGENATIQVFPAHGRFLVQGVRSLNFPGQVKVHQVLAGSGVPRNAAPFDSAAYAIGHDPKGAELAEHAAYYRAPWGWISHQHPLLLTFGALGCPCVLPFLSWTLYGVFEVEHDAEQPELALREVVEPRAPEPEKPNLWPRRDPFGKGGR